MSLRSWFGFKSHAQPADDGQRHSAPAPVTIPPQSEKRPWASRMFSNGDPSMYQTMLSPTLAGVAAGAGSSTPTSAQLDLLRGSFPDPVATTSGSTLRSSSSSLPSGLDAADRSGSTLPQSISEPSRSTLDLLQSHAPGADVGPSSSRPSSRGSVFTGEADLSRLSWGGGPVRYEGDSDLTAPQMDFLHSKWTFGAGMKLPTHPSTGPKSTSSTLQSSSTSSLSSTTSTSSSSGHLELGHPSHLNSILSPSLAGDPGTIAVGSRDEPRTGPPQRAATRSPLDYADASHFSTLLSASLAGTPDDHTLPAATKSQPKRDLKHDLDERVRIHKRDVPAVDARRWAEHRALQARRSASDRAAEARQTVEEGAAEIRQTIEKEVAEAGRVAEAALTAVEEAGHAAVQTVEQGVNEGRRALSALTTSAPAAAPVERQAEVSALETSQTASAEPQSGLGRHESIHPSHFNTMLSPSLAGLPEDLVRARAPAAASSSSRNSTTMSSADPSHYNTLLSPSLAGSPEYVPQRAAPKDPTRDLEDRVKAQRHIIPAVDARRWAEHRVQQAREGPTTAPPAESQSSLPNTSSASATGASAPPTRVAKPAPVSRDGGDLAPMSSMSMPAYSGFLSTSLAGFQVPTAAR